MVCVRLNTKLVAIEGPLISMTLSTLMMRNFSRNLNIINFLFCYHEALLLLLLLWLEMLLTLLLLLLSCLFVNFAVNM